MLSCHFATCEVWRLSFTDPKPQEVKGNVELLERMQAVNVLVRKLLRFLFDARKLRSQMDAPGKDFSKAAHTLHELESVLQEQS